MVPKQHDETRSTTAAWSRGVERIVYGLGGLMSGGPGLRLGLGVLLIVLAAACVAAIQWLAVQYF